MDWHDLTDKERREKIKRLQEWWENPSDEDPPQIVSDLRVLAMTDLARDHRGAYASFPAEISDLMGGYDVSKEMVLSTMHYWRESRQTGKKFNGDVLVQWCADQIAAALVFMNLRPMQSASAPQKRLWDSLLCRVVDHIFIRLLARNARRQTGNVARIFAEKEVLSDRFIQLILEDRKFEFQFQREGGDGQKKSIISAGVGAAITYFMNAWQSEERHRQRKERKPLPGKEKLPSPDSSEEFPMQNDPDSRRQALWEAIDMVLKPEHKTKLITLSELQHRGLTWARIEEELKHLIRDPTWRILNNPDLLPGITLDEVRRAFEGMKLNEVNLRQFSSRMWRELFRHFGCS